MRSTAATRTALTPTARTTAGGRTTAASEGGQRTGGVSRPTLANVPGRAKKSTADAGPRQGVGTGGWAGYNKKRQERSESYPRLTVEKTGQKFIKFVQAEPFAFIYRHWASKRPYTCIADPENEVECPLCEAALGDSDLAAKPVVFYNVIDLEDARVKVWEMSSDPTRKVRKQYDQLADMEPARSLDDPEFYFAVSKSQKERSSWEYAVDRIKARDLSEDWGMDPLDEDEIAAAMEKVYDDSIIYVSSRERLEEAAQDA